MANNEQIGTFNEGYAKGYEDGYLKAKAIYLAHKGRWVCDDIEHMEFHCSECEAFNDNRADKYCHDCGARMEN